MIVTPWGVTKYLGKYVIEYFPRGGGKEKISIKTLCGEYVAWVDFENGKETGYNNTPFSIKRLREEAKKLVEKQRAFLKAQEDELPF